MRHRKSVFPSPVLPPKSPLTRFSSGQNWQLILNCLEDISKGQSEQTVEKMHLSSLCGKTTTTLADVVLSLSTAGRRGLLQQKNHLYFIYFPPKHPSSAGPSHSALLPIILSPEVQVIVFSPSTSGSKEPQRNPLQLSNVRMWGWHEEKVRSRNCGWYYTFYSLKKHKGKVKCALWYYCLIQFSTSWHCLDCFCISNGGTEVMNGSMYRWLRCF